MEGRGGGGGVEVEGVLFVFFGIWYFRGSLSTSSLKPGVLVLVQVFRVFDT